MDSCRRSSSKLWYFYHNRRRLFRNFRLLIRFGTRYLGGFDWLFFLSFTTRRELCSFGGLASHFCFLSNTYLRGSKYRFTTILRFTVRMRGINGKFLLVYVCRVNDHGTYAFIRTRIRFPIGTRERSPFTIIGIIKESTRVNRCDICLSSVIVAWGVIRMAGITSCGDGVQVVCGITLNVFILIRSWRTSSISRP